MNYHLRSLIAYSLIFLLSVIPMFFDQSGDTLGQLLRGFAALLSAGGAVISGVALRREKRRDNEIRP